MKHEELLAVIYHYGMLERFMADVVYKVAELHRPKSIAVSAGTNEPFTYQEVCDLCIKPYPCETIRAIEEKL
jgi:hypothetical protein